MIVREVYSEEKKSFNQVAHHPLQSWEWGKFKEKTGVKVIRLGAYAKKKLQAAYQVSIHPLPIPKTNLRIIYFPKGPMPDKRMLRALKKLGQKEGAVFARLEPNVGSVIKKPGTTKFTAIKTFLATNGCQPGRPLFTRYTLRINLKQSEEELLSKMKEKTRYNLRLAQKNDVQVVEDNSPEAFASYLKLTAETTKRQKFYSHSLDYHRKMWSVLHPAGIAHLLLAKYKGQVLTAWILFTFKKTLYYPYGASSREYREVMPAYAMMWEAIKFGQKQGLATFDLWGSLGPEPDPNDPWFGFHRFKMGFGPQIVEFVGTYDLVVNNQLYPWVRRAEDLRWKFLKLKTKFFS